jgi:Amt family ammonium transporter
MSHELRTPLNAMIGFTELLAAGLPTPLPEEQRRYAQDALDAGRELLRRIDEMLAFIRADSGELRADMQTLATEYFLDACVHASLPTAREKGIELALSVAPDCPALLTDRTLLRRVLDNLLGNALKFTPAGGRVEVSAAPCAEEPGKVEIAVSDTGIGIAEADLPRLFEPFMQLDGGVARKHGGAGLGLALVSRLLRLIEGQITVTSAPGKGSRFSLRLPRADDIKSSGGNADKKGIIS